VAERVPPGRAGRLWLLARLDAARRGRELLDRKRQLLGREQQRLALVADERRKSWEEASEGAQRWALRAAILGGTATTALFAGTVTGRATVDVAWRNTMGVTHPDDARCEFPTLAPAAAVAGNAALAPAAQAHCKALEAAVAAAIAAKARQLIEAELQATQRRLRGLERHRIPSLERSLHELQFRLDELEREERVVTRWARERRGVDA
jgi:V/A-type H+-transporting ATPase subunit D